MPPSKRKKASGFRDYSSDNDDQAPSEDLSSTHAAPGYVEQHTMYRVRPGAQGNIREAESSVFHLPPSPVKKARVGATTEHMGMPVESPIMTAPVGPSPNDPESGVWDSPEELQGEPATRSTYPSVSVIKYTLFYLSCLIFSVVDRNKDNPLAIFAASVDVFLDEMLRHESNRYTDGRCTGCRGEFEGGCFRCKDCAIGGLWCRECLLSSHQFNFLHRLEAS